MKTKPIVALVSMPFAPVLMPSIGLSLLKASLGRAEISANIFYFNIRFAELLEEKLYSRVSGETNTHDLIGEWIFSNSLFEHQSAHEVERYVEEILRCQVANSDSSWSRFAPLPENFIQEIIAARAKVETFLGECLDEVVNTQPGVVGFTSVFQQHIASLSLARRIKARLPSTFIVFGGANCEGIMGSELIRQFDFVDAVISGEGEIVFPELVRRILCNKSFGDLRGVYCRTGSHLSVLNGAEKNTSAIADLDSLPIPDYDDFFEQLSHSSLRLSKKPSLLFETSRGCWWGQKHHCTFCGLNGETMTYRSKTAKRAMDELVYLCDRYPGYAVNVVDNILDMSYFKDLLRQLAERKLGLNIFYEVKSNLRKEQVRLLRDAGVLDIQPGIESLSDQVLQIMRKGVKALQNIQLLKWCKEFGIRPHWNLIWGFPGESLEEYEKMAGLIPLLAHLPPPSGTAKIRIDRFSPNFNDAEHLGFKNVTPYPAYHFVYPLSREAVRNLSYFFTFDYITHPADLGYVEPVLEALKEWHARHQDSQMFWVEKGEYLLLWDFRTIAVESLTVLTGLRKFVYIASDQVRTARQIYELWKLNEDRPVDIEEIICTLEQFTAKGLMLRQGDSYLALAISQQLKET